MDRLTLKDGTGSALANGSPEDQVELTPTTTVTSSTCDSNGAHNRDVVSHLLDILEDRHSAECHEFRRYLEAEVSQENLIFWFKCETYKQLVDHPDADAQVAIAHLRKVWSQHVRADSAQQVNLEQAVRDAVWKALTDATASVGEGKEKCMPDYHALDAAQKQVLHIMAHNQFPRFLLYRETGNGVDCDGLYQGPISTPTASFFEHAFVRDNKNFKSGTSTCGKCGKYIFVQAQRCLYCRVCCHLECALEAVEAQMPCPRTGNRRSLFDVPLVPSDTSEKAASVLGATPLDSSRAADGPVVTGRAMKLLGPKSLASFSRLDQVGPPTPGSHRPPDDGLDNAASTPRRKSSSSNRHLAGLFAIGDNMMGRLEGTASNLGRAEGSEVYSGSCDQDLRHCAMSPGGQPPVRRLYSYSDSGAVATYRLARSLSSALGRTRSSTSDGPADEPRLHSQSNDGTGKRGGVVPTDSIDSLLGRALDLPSSSQDYLGLVCEDLPWFGDATPVNTPTDRRLHRQNVFSFSADGAMYGRQRSLSKDDMHVSGIPEGVVLGEEEMEEEITPEHETPNKDRRLQSSSLAWDFHLEEPEQAKQADGTEEEGLAFTGCPYRTMELVDVNEQKGKPLKSKSNDFSTQFLQVFDSKVPTRPGSTGLAGYLGRKQAPAKTETAPGSPLQEIIDLAESTDSALGDKRRNSRGQKIMKGLKKVIGKGT